MAQIIGGGAAVAPLHLVPDEIINHLLYYISPSDNLSGLQLVSRRFNRLANEPLLWKYHCCSNFQYWHPTHKFHDKVTRLVEHTDWKRLFILRISRNERIATLLNDIISTKVGRIKRFEQIAQLGYDAKDFLLEQCQTDPSLDDGLATRYYSNAILDSIHRSIAIEEWHSLQQVPEQHMSQVTGVQLERALGAFDLFVLHDQPGDLDDITYMLDEVAFSFRSSQPNFHELTTRQKALTLLRWLRSQNFTGVHNPERNYRNLRNCLIGQALRHEEHESIPIISTAIFCCIASRLGMDTRCCAFPSHVHAIVYPAPGYTLDDLPVKPKQRNDPPQRMFLDPYGNDEEVPAYALRAMLAQFGWQTNMEVFLAPVSALSITMRTAQNLKATIARIQELNDHVHSELSQLIRGDNAMNVEACLYAASWASLVLTPPNSLEWVDRLAKFLRRFAGSWPEDAWLIEKYLWPSPSTGPEPHVVAAHNIELISDPNLVTDDMFPLAGKFFKRFDTKTCTFISNIKEQFPDD
ncbi:hypothetical protein PT974_04172 [Cladobotryum mycophilum]|uniref:F-box domain-containing protein n=1 Tax=Cladobotryum mycophilum TaxID=491253 RepID=A0ABR0SUC9_9HYPO